MAVVPSKGRGGMYAPQRNETRAQRTRSVFFLLGIAAVIGWFYVLFMSDLFVVNEVEVMGLQSLDPVEVNREVFLALDAARGEWRPWSPRHAWFIDTEALSNELKDRLFAENVTVDKTYTHVLRLSVEERSNKFIFHSHQQYFWGDLQGAATQELTPDERKQVQMRILGTRVPQVSEPPVIHRDLDDQVAAGYRIADTDEVKNWIRASSEIMKDGLLYREFEPPGASSTRAIVISPEGYDVYVDIQDPLEPQIASYLMFKKSLTSDIKITQYVDVRVPGKIFVK